MTVGMGEDSLLRILANSEPSTNAFASLWSSKKLVFENRCMNGLKVYSTTGSSGGGGAVNLRPEPTWSTNQLVSRRPVFSSQSSMLMMYCILRGVLVAALIAPERSSDGWENVWPANLLNVFSNMKVVLGTHLVESYFQ
jgi:hypothetical protein